MNDAQRLKVLNAAVRELKLTSQGHIQWVKEGKKGGHWKAAFNQLTQLADDLRPDPKPPVTVPQLGPLQKGGKSILTMSLTHRTSGIDYYPALDSVFVEGMEVLAIEDIIVSRTSSSRPGLAFYCTGDSDIKYWYGHLDRTHSPGKKFKKGAVVGRVCRNAIGGGPHTHLGINIEQLVGRKKQLKYGKTGTGPDYTFGSPTIGTQLTQIFKTLQEV